MLMEAEAGELPDFSFLDLRSDLILGELGRREEVHRTGPHTQGLLRAVHASGSPLR